MRKIIAIILGLVSHTLIAQSPFVGLSNDAVLEDLAYMQTQIETFHPEPYLFISQNDFKVRVEEFQRDLPGMNDDEKLVGLLGLLTAIGQGHCNLRPFDHYSRVAISIDVIAGEYRVISIDENHASLLGSVPKAINGMPIAEVLAKLSMVVPQHETTSFSEGWISYYLTVGQILHGLGIINNNESIKYQFELKDGTLASLTLPTNSPEGRAAIKRVSATKQRPLYRQRQQEITDEGGRGLWVKQMDNFLYFRFSSYPPTKVFKQFRKKIAKAIRNDPSKRLFLDLRQNGGGDFIRVRKHFLPTLEKAVKKSGTQVYVGIGANTFSAAVSNATDFVKHLKGVLIGEITSGRPNGYQDNCGFVLPNSKIPGSTACTYREFIDEDTPGLFPEIEVNTTWEHYVNGLDPIMEYLNK